MSERLSGTVKSFDASTGNGFIERQGGPDIFRFHVSAIQSKGSQTLRPGQAVEFDVERAPKGLKSVNIVVKK